MRKPMLVLILALVLLALSACGPPSVAQSVDVAQGGGATNGCPVATDGMQLLMHGVHGYCLLYPVGYNVFYPSENGVSIVVGSLMNHTEPSASIQVEEAAGRTVAQAVEELMVEFDHGVGFDIKRSSVTVGSEEAIVLDNMPGQDLHRRVVVIHDGILYWLHFAPVGADYGEVGTRTEVLYTTVIDSLRFLPGGVVVSQGGQPEDLSNGQDLGEDVHSPGAELPPGPRLVIQRPDNSIQYVTLDGSSAVLVSDAPSSLLPAGYGDVPVGGAPMTDGPAVYVRQWSGGLYVLDTILGQLFSLDFVPSPCPLLAVRPLTEGPLPEGAPISLAWGEFSAADTTTARLYLSVPDGSQIVQALEGTYGASDPPAQFVPWRWRQDGQLYYIKQPVGGMGGFPPFVHAANLWVLDLQSGSSRELVSDGVTGGMLCLAEIAPGDRLVAHLCDEGRITLLDLETGQVTAIGLPDQTPSDALVGSVRFSPDGSRIAFAAMTGGMGMVEETRGYAAVSDVLSGSSRIVATSETGEWFSVVAWLPHDTLVLQSHSAGPSGWPAVWIVRTDGSGLVKLADGTFLAKFDG